MLFFTNKGKVYRLKVHQLPRMSRTAKGRHIANMLPLAGDERIATVIATKEFNESDYLMFATRGGVVKKTKFGDYNTPLKNDGIIAINLADEDELIAVRQVSDGEEMILVTRNGQSLRFDQEDARAQGRATGGVRGIKFRDGDAVLSMDTVSDELDLFMITEKGFGKRTPLSQFRAQGRGGQGVIAMKTDGERGKLAGVRVVNPEMHELVIVSNLGTTIRLGAESVSQQGRTAQGVRVMNLRDGDSVSALASVVSSRDDGQGSEEELSVEELVSEEVAAEAAAPNGQAESLGAPEPSENGGGEPDE
jgi:DNA gyrase subunit A